MILGFEIPICAWKKLCSILCSLDERGLSSLCFVCLEFGGDLYWPIDVVTKW